MTATISLFSSSNRYGTATYWHADGNTYDTGDAQTASHAWWVTDGSDNVIDFGFGCRRFGMVWDYDTDNGQTRRLYYQTIEEGQTTPTEEMDEWTQSVTAWSRTLYVANGGVDDTTPGRGESSGNPYATIDYAITRAEATWTPGESCRILANRGETHTVVVQMHYPGSQNGRLGLGAYGTGAVPTFTYSTDDWLFTIGQGFNDNHLTLDWRDCAITGPSSTATAEVIRFNANNSATSPAPSFSFVGRNLAFTNCGGIAGTAIDNGGLSEANGTDGRCDHIAWQDVSLSGCGDYGWYSGNSHLPRYLILDNVSFNNLQASGVGTAMRNYGWRHAYLRGVICTDHNADAFRFLSGGSNTALHCSYVSFVGCGSAQGPYTFHNTDADGGAAGERNDWLAIDYLDCKLNSTEAAGSGIVQGGVRTGITIANCFFSRTSIDLPETDSANRTVTDLHILSNTFYYDSISGGDGVGVRSSLTSAATWTGTRVQNNFIVAASGTSATVNFFNNGGSSIAQSVLEASDRNVFVLPSTCGVNMYGGITGGGVALATWQTNSPFDDNSQVLIGTGTHGLTSVGTANTTAPASLDPSISTSSSARNAGMAITRVWVDIDGQLRVSTHDAGCSDADATGPPSDPGGGSGITGTLTGLGRTTLTAAGSVGVGGTASQRGGLTSTEVGQVAIGGTASAVGQARGAAAGGVAATGSASALFRFSATAVATAGIGGTASALLRAAGAGAAALEVKGDVSAIFRLGAHTAAGAAGMPGTLLGLGGTTLVAAGLVGIGGSLQALAGGGEASGASVALTGGAAGIGGAQLAAVGVLGGVIAGTATEAMGGTLTAYGLVADLPQQQRWPEPRRRRRLPRWFDSFWQD